jgi:transcriptional regulator with XRE-family HTH domain
MTAKQFKDTLHRLDISQVDAARKLGVDPRTVRHWIAGDRAVHPTAAILLRLLVAGKITVADVEGARK